jgi:hypothetical protein
MQHDVMIVICRCTVFCASLVVTVGLEDYNTPLPALTAWIDDVTIDFP